MSTRAATPYAAIVLRQRPTGLGSLFLRVGCDTLRSFKIVIPTPRYTCTVLVGMMEDWRSAEIQNQNNA